MWQQAAIFGPIPSGRTEAALALHGIGMNSRVVLFGGQAAGAALQDLWGFGT